MKEKRKLITKGLLYGGFPSRSKNARYFTKRCTTLTILTVNCFMCEDWVAEGKLETCKQIENKTVATTHQVKIIIFSRE